MICLNSFFLKRACVRRSSIIRSRFPGCRFLAVVHITSIESDLADRPAPTNHPADLVPGAPLAYRPRAPAGLVSGLSDTDDLSQAIGTQGMAGRWLTARAPRTTADGRPSSPTPAEGIGRLPTPGRPMLALLHLVGRVMCVTTDRLNVLPASPEPLRKLRFRAIGHIPQCRFQIRIQQVRVGKVPEDIRDVTDSNLRTKARAIPVSWRKRNAFHEYTKCVLDDLLGAIATLSVSASK